MNIPTQGLYCVVKNDGLKKGRVEATSRLASTLNLSDQRAEIKLLYAAISPTWLYLTDLYMTLSRLGMLEGDESATQTINLLEVRHGSEADVLNNVQQQMITVFGTKYPWIKLTKSAGEYSFKLRKSSKVEFSTGLSNLLAVQPVIENDDKSKQMDIPIQFNVPPMHAHDNIYYVKCDAVLPNYVHEGHLDRTLGVLYITNSTAFEHVPIAAEYTKIEENLLEHITLRLYNAENEPVNSDSVDLFFICHIRSLDGSSSS